jgi:membrane protein implicated in regulation of membrane protease activity
MELVCMGIGAILAVVVIVLIIRSQIQPDFHGIERMVGRKGFVISVDISLGKMRVEVNGESWKAEGDTAHRFTQGEEVVVTRVDADSLTLFVEAAQ